MKNLNYARMQRNPVGVSTVVMCVWTFLLMLLLAPGSSFSQVRTGLQSATALRSAPDAPQEVHAGIYVTELNEISIQDHSFFADFYVWFRWQGDIDPRKFEFVNAKESSCDPNDDKTANGFHYVTWHCRATFHSEFKLRSYPLDQQTLTIEVEDVNHTTEALLYKPDLQHSQTESLESPSWKVGRAIPSVVIHEYASSLGDPGVEEGKRAKYSRFVMQVPIQHPRIVYAKTFLILFMSTAIGFVACLLPASQLEPRLGIGVASIFGIVSSYVVVGQNLPQVVEFTLADQLHILSIACVFVAILESAILFRITARGEHTNTAALQADRMVSVLLPVMYFILVAVFTALSLSR